MTAQKTLIITTLLIICCGLTYSIGYQKATQDYKEQVSQRYVKTINPSTEQEQCNFEYIVYGECKN